MISDWIEKHLGGSINIGNRVTIYGQNAMHWAVNIRTKRWGYVCFRLPFFSFGYWWPLYFYVSPNGTPWASTFAIGKGCQERCRAMMRRHTFGHNFDVDENYEELCVINDYPM